MKQLIENACSNRELGQLMETIRRTCPANGKCLTINELCRIAGMSTRTYAKIKRG